MVPKKEENMKIRVDDKYVYLIEINDTYDDSIFISNNRSNFFGVKIGENREEAIENLLAIVSILQNDKVDLTREEN